MLKPCQNYSHLLVQAYEIVFTERDLVEREEKNNKVLALLRRKSKSKVIHKSFFICEMKPLSVGHQGPTNRKQGDTSSAHSYVAVVFYSDITRLNVPLHRPPCQPVGHRWPTVYNFIIFRERTFMKMLETKKCYECEKYKVLRKYFFIFDHC